MRRSKPPRKRETGPMKNGTKVYVGMDVHRDTVMSTVFPEGVREPEDGEAVVARSAGARRLLDRLAPAACGSRLLRVVRNKIEAAYRRTDLFERRRRLMEDWAACLAAETRMPDRPIDPPTVLGVRASSLEANLDHRSPRESVLDQRPPRTSCSAMRRTRPPGRARGRCRWRHTRGEAGPPGRPGPYGRLRQGHCPGPRSAAGITSMHERDCAAVFFS